MANFHLFWLFVYFSETKPHSLQSLFASQCHGILKVFDLFVRLFAKKTLGVRKFCSPKVPFSSLDDFNRVVLEPSSGASTSDYESPEDSDYINASYVDVSKKNNENPLIRVVTSWLLEVKLPYDPVCHEQAVYFIIDSFKQ